MQTLYYGCSVLQCISRHESAIMTIMTDRTEKIRQCKTCNKFPILSIADSRPKVILVSARGNTFNFSRCKQEKSKITLKQQKFRNFAVMVPALSEGHLCDIDGNSGKLSVHLSIPERVFVILIYKPPFL